MMRIAPRFCGPPESGNGGYCAGLLAKRMPGPAEVTLRSPPPLDRTLTVVETPERLDVCDGDVLVAEARRATLELEVPTCPSFARASELSRHYIGHKVHHFPSCFVCGPARTQGDGLRIFPGAEQGTQLVAAPWIPDADLSDAGGNVQPEFIWAALDCIGYFASAAPDYPISLLGRMTVDVMHRVEPEERCVVIGWPLGRDGRKLYAGTAVFGSGGRLCACARQTWILMGGPNSSGARSLRLSSRPPASTRG